MATQRGPKIVTSGLVLCLDAADTKSYSGSGTSWNDLSGNNVIGTLTNGPTFSSSNGGSIVFDGVNDFVSVPNQTALVNKSQFTLACWAKRRLSTSRVNIYQAIDLNNGISLAALGDSNVYVEVSNGSHPYGYVANSGSNWQNFVMVFDGSLTGNSNRLKLYVNGVLQTLTFNGTIPATSSSSVNSIFCIGNTQGTGNNDYSDGNFAQVSIYNRALSVSEVLQNFNAQRGRFGI